METDDDQPVNYSPCLICSSPVISADIKLEPDLDEKDYDCQSVINFLVATVLEMPLNELEQKQEALTNQQLNIPFCEQCTNLIYSAKQIYTQILEISQKFRKVQKQIVQQIFNSGGDHHCGTKLSTSNHNELLDFCRNFLTKHDFNGFDYPFVVNRIPIKSYHPSSQLSECQDDDDDDEPSVDKVKEEPLSENEDGHEDDNCGSNENDDDDPDEGDHRNSTTPASSDDEDNQNESDPDLDPPPPPPPKRRAKKSPPKKPPVRRGPHTGKTRARLARIVATLSSNPLAANKRGFIKKLSKFERLHPNYPKLLPDPITSKFHCGEPSCSKVYPRKRSLERHIIVEHLQDNFYKCADCDKSFACKETFQDHTSWHANLPRWKCQEKVKVTDSANTTTSDGENLQQFCTEQFFSRKQLNRHVVQVHKQDAPTICEICGKRLSCQDYLSNHKYQYHNADKPKDYKPIKKKEEPTSQICNYCGKTFKCKAGLDLHINLMHEKTVGKFGCQFCEWKFNRKIWLQQHLWRKHDKFSLDGYTPPPPPPQKEGPRKFRESGRKKMVGNLTESTIKRKYWIGKTFQCEVKGCKVGYWREENLKKHVEERHGGNKEGGGGGGIWGGVYYRFLCKYCGKGFHKKFKKEFHEEAHENKESKPFGCEICGKGFATLAYLKIHLRNIHKSGNGDGGGAGSEKANT